MKNYKDFEKVFIGDSDIASLTLRSPMEATVLNFGEDNSYKAYIVEGNAEIGEHYDKVYECNNWLKIYDDDGLSAEFDADYIAVYRAGEIGCIIQLG